MTVLLLSATTFNHDILSEALDTAEVASKEKARQLEPSTKHVAKRRKISTRKSNNGHLHVPLLHSSLEPFPICLISRKLDITYHCSEQSFENIRNKSLSQNTSSRLSVQLYVYEQLPGDDLNTTTYEISILRADNKDQVIYSGRLAAGSEANALSMEVSAIDAASSSKNIRQASQFLRISPTALDLESFSYDPLTQSASITLSYNCSIVSMYVWNYFTNGKLLAEKVYRRLLELAFPATVGSMVDPCQASRNPEPAVSAREFYKSICHHNQQNESRPESRDTMAEVQHPSLRTALLPFQRESVKWMLNIEGKKYSEENGKFVNLEESDAPASFCGWTMAKDALDNQVWINRIQGLVCNDLASLKTSWLNDHLMGGKGLLAEEMGLGKTVEMISLILLNPRPSTELGSYIYNPEWDSNMKMIKATLIITPLTILYQWKEELEKHAPSLNVLVLCNRKDLHDTDDDTFEKCDVLLCSYQVLSSDLHFVSKPPQRHMRFEKRHEHTKSILVRFQFWRVLLDEVQMVESGVTNAAVVARKVSRINAWGVSGTPVKRGLNDLRGLLMFLRYNPFASEAKVWSSLVQNPSEFCNLFASIALRHTKSMVSRDLHLPQQTRIRMSLPFTHIEQSNYDHLFNLFLRKCGLDSSGAPSNGEWNPDDATLSLISSWLTKLRMTCNHAELRQQTKLTSAGAAGENNPRTVADVLESMTEQALTNLRSDERALYLSMVQRAQLLEQIKEPKEALEIFLSALAGLESVIDETETELKVATLKSDGAAVKSNSGNKSNSDELSEQEEESEDEDEDEERRLGSIRSRYRGFLELKHRCLFFIGSLYFQLEDQDKEKDFYNKAEEIRRIILKDSIAKSAGSIFSLAKRVIRQQFVEIPDATSGEEELKGGLESQMWADHMKQLGIYLNQQAEMIDEWRESLIGLLRSPLVDQAEDPNGEEYANSLKSQEMAFIFMGHLHRMIAERIEAVTGVRNNLLLAEDADREETAVAAQEDAEDEVAKELKYLDKELKRVADEIRSAYDTPNMKMILDAFRRTADSNIFDGSGMSRRQQVEIELSKKRYKAASNQYELHKKVCADLEKEIGYFNRVYNQRLEYYRQLQEISDNVAEFVVANDKAFVSRAIIGEEKLKVRISQGRSRLRYLEHLAKMSGESNKEGQQETFCVICQSSISLGRMTSCGHQFCEDCFILWLRHHHSCPMCKRTVHKNDTYKVDYRDRKAIASEEKMDHGEDSHQESHQEENSDKENVIARVSAIDSRLILDSDMGPAIIKEISSMKLRTLSYGSKLDTIIRHVLWLKSKDPFVRIVIFSQWGHFLRILSGALKLNDVGVCDAKDVYSRRHRSSGVNHNNNNSSSSNRNESGGMYNTCFLLHSKSQAAGLTLVNATHVFLCEPLVNTGLELQAVSRIHRIGQTRQTTVWSYCIVGTVEESIQAMATRRRIRLIYGTRAEDKQPKEWNSYDASSSSSSSSSTTRSFDEVQSNDIIETASDYEQDASSKLVDKKSDGGELVSYQDVWEAFFGSRNT